MSISNYFSFHMCTPCFWQWEPRSHYPWSFCYMINHSAIATASPFTTWGPSSGLLGFNTLSGLPSSVPCPLPPFSSSSIPCQAAPKILGWTLPSSPCLDFSISGQAAPLAKRMPSLPASGFISMHRAILLTLPELWQPAKDLPPFYPRSLKPIWKNRKTSTVFYIKNV